MLITIIYIGARGEEKWWPYKSGCQTLDTTIKTRSSSLPRFCFICLREAPGGCLVWPLFLLCHCCGWFLIMLTEEFAVAWDCLLTAIVFFLFALVLASSSASESVLHFSQPGSWWIYWSSSSPFPLPLLGFCLPERLIWIADQWKKWGLSTLHLGDSCTEPLFPCFFLRNHLLCLSFFCCRSSLSLLWIRFYWFRFQENIFILLCFLPSSPAVFRLLLTTIKLVWNVVTYL